MTRRPDSTASTLRLRLDIAYDGTGFSGWAVQPGQRTVQAEIERAFRTVLHLSEAPKVICAGRTDAGVHARGQVAHVDVPTAEFADVRELIGYRLRGTLPEDIRVFSVREVSGDFNARYSALSRRYSYSLCDSYTGPDPLQRWNVVSHPNVLNVPLMNKAAELLLGRHDFAAFCKQREGSTSIRRLLNAEWSRTGDVVVLSILGDSFCHSMVRALVGAFLPVGDGRRNVDWPYEILMSGLRHAVAAVAPAHGLVLEEVRYPSDDELLARQAVTRQMRELPKAPPNFGA